MWMPLIVRMLRFQIIACAHVAMFTPRRHKRERIPRQQAQSEAVKTIKDITCDVIPLLYGSRGVRLLFFIILLFFIVM